MKQVITKYEVEILADPGEVYAEGDTIDASDFINDYIGANDKNESLCDYITTATIPEALAYICEAWGIEANLVVHTISTTIVPILRVYNENY